MSRTAFFAAIAIGLPAHALAQPTPATDPPATPAPGLEARVKALEDDVEDVQDENEDLRSQVKDLEERLASSRPPPALNALNPQITAFLNGAARFDDRPTTTPGGARTDDRLFMRTLEVDFRAAVDPFADAVATLSLEGLAEGGYEADLEEGYVVVKRLPILDAAPLGLKLKLGRYRAPFGVANKIHMHDLPWTTRPLPVSRLLGNEQGELFEAGWSPVGADAEVILPQIIDGAVMELNADVVDGGALPVSASEGRRLGFLGHYNLFFTVGDVHDVNLGASAYVERGDAYARLYGADLTYTWKPMGRNTSAVLGGEVMYADRKLADDTGALVHNTPLAWYAFAQLQTGWHTYVGARYDLAEDPADDSLTTRVAAGYVSYYTSEFLRFRVGYEHRWSDVPADDGTNSVLGEINIVFGSHPTEPYWVNR